MQRGNWEGLIADYPLVCNNDILRLSHKAIPNGIQLLGVDTLASLPAVDLITAGWECQGRSKAERGKGLRDHRSALIYDLVHVIALCQAQNKPAVGHLLENVNISDDTRDNFVMDSQTIRYVLGTEVITDGANHTSCAHRLRVFWTNMVNPGQF